MMTAQLQQAGGAAPARGDPTVDVDASSVDPPLRNRAADSKSPFVRELADSPVSWQLLDDEAVDRAKKENKLIFLHIGFLACHYCRLTRQDSFSNTSVAALLNESFVPVVVDREERPDVDAVYWNYIQLVNSDAGWPINVFLTPELEPVFGGSYWHGPGTESAVSDGRQEEGLDFLEILQKLQRAWDEREAQCRSETVDTVQKLRKFAAEGTQAPRRRTPVLSAADLEVDLDQLEEAYEQIAATYDHLHGGFGLAPKFLTPAKFAFLLRLAQLPQDVRDVVGTAEVEHATEMALTTLRKMRDGGIHDQIGAGFSRLSTTQDWTLPKFEKMLADNALLLGLYLDAWISTSGGRPSRNGEFADVVYELSEYLTSPPICQNGGAFATSEGADSLGKKGDEHTREGAYYVWTRREFDTVVGDGGDDQLVASVAAAYWNVFEHGNVESVHDPTDEFISQNILYVDVDEAGVGKQLGIAEDEVKRIIASSRAKLLLHREKERDRPQTDRKIVTCHNGMAIGALAKTGATLRQGGLDEERGEKYVAAAERAARFIKTELWDPRSRTLFRLYHDGRGDTEGFADDYAFLIHGLLELYAATEKREWLAWAEELQERQIDLFYDHIDLGRSKAPPANRPLGSRDPDLGLGHGAFYSTSAAASHTILRLKDGMDTSQPSTNGISVSNLFRLASHLGKENYSQLALETIHAFEVEMLQHPWLFPTLLYGVVTARLGSSSAGASSG